MRHGLLPLIIILFTACRPGLVQPPAALGPTPVEVTQSTPSPTPTLTPPEAITGTSTVAPPTLTPLPPPTPTLPLPYIQTTVAPTAVPATASQVRGSQGMLTLYSLPQPDGYIRALAVDRAGRVWAASAVHLNVLEPETQTWTVYTTANGLPGAVSALSFDGQGWVWAGTGNGIGIFDGQTWQSDLGGYWVTALGVAPDESVWAGTAQGTVYRFDGQTWTQLQKPPVVTVDAIAFDLAGRVWVGGLGGAAVWDGAAWTHYQTADGFELQKVNAITVGLNGDLWLGAGECYLTAEECTNAGISRFDGRSWTHYFTSVFRQMGGSSRRVFAITFDRTGNGWFGSGEGFRKFDGEEWTSYSEFYGSVHDVHAIAVDSANHKWLGTSYGVARYSE